MMGLDTFDIYDAGYLKKAATMLGYRAFFTASDYNNEEVVGYALDELLNVYNSVKRDELFIISKVALDEEDDVEVLCRLSLMKMGIK